MNTKLENKISKNNILLDICSFPLLEYKIKFSTVK